jgi:glucose-1-phosphate thymidylyltransferase
MPERVTNAIIDATAGAAVEPSAVSATSRYATPIANLPLICHVFDELAGAGIGQARVIASTTIRSELERVLDGGRSWGISVSFIDTGTDDGESAVLTEIDDALSEGSVIVHPGDCLFPRQVAKMCERYESGDVDLVLLGAEARAPRRSAARDPRAPDRVTETALLLAPPTRPILHELLAPSEGRRDLVDSLLESDIRTSVCDLAEHWFYGDSNESLLAANRMLLDALPVPAVEGEFGEGNRVHGRVAISPEARISGCTLHGPIVIDDGAVVEDSFIGPYTAIGAGSVVSGADIDNSMVLARAELRHPGLRIESSIIGERASVIRSFELPKGLHLRLGPDSQVTLS